jgi:hypothetical protein
MVAFEASRPEPAPWIVRLSRFGFATILMFRFSLKVPLTTETTVVVVEGAVSALSTAAWMVAKQCGVLEGSTHELTIAALALA